MLQKSGGWIDCVQQGTAGKMEFELGQMGCSHLKEGEESKAFQKIVYPPMQAALYVIAHRNCLAEEYLNKPLRLEVGTCWALV